MARRFPTSPLNFRMRSRIHVALMAHSGRLRTVTGSPAAVALGSRTRCWPVRVPHSTSLHIHRSSAVRRRLDYSTIASSLDQLLFEAYPLCTWEHSRTRLCCSSSQSSLDHAAAYVHCQRATVMSMHVGVRMYDATSVHFVSPYSLATSVGSMLAPSRSL